MDLLTFFVVIVVPIALVGLLVMPYLRVGIDLADEGYLVFGTARLIQGEVPIRDFRAYDPGRYIWCALFALVFGRSFRAVRVAMAVAMAIALGLLADLMLRASDAPLFSVLTCILAFVWMQPRHKQIENLFAVLSIVLLFNLSLEGQPWDYAVLGAAMGLAAFFGLNIAVYLVAASLLLVLLDVGLPDLAALRAFGIGLGLGLIPVIAMVVGVKGYAMEYLRRKVVALLRRGSTNLKRPLPWVWARKTPSLDAFSPARRFGIKVIFTAMPAVFLTGLILPLHVWDTPLSDPHRLIFCASCVGLVSFYHTVSRADLAHLFLPALPLCVVISAASLAAFDVLVANAIITGLLVLSVWLVFQKPFHWPGYRRARADLVPIQYQNERLFVTAKQADHFKRLHQITSDYSRPNETILAVPAQIGLCALFGRRHAIYDSFPVYPSSRRSRRELILDLTTTRPKLLFIGTGTIDQRQELIFLENHPDVTWQIVLEYTFLEQVGSCAIYVRSDVLPFSTAV